MLAASWLDRFAAGLGSILFGGTVAILAIRQGLEQKFNQLQFNWRPIAILIPIGLIVVWIAYVLWPRWKNHFAGRSISALIRGLCRFRSAPQIAIAGIVLGAVVQCCLSGVLAFALQSITQTAIPWQHLFWTFPIISLLSALPISTSGVGVREGSSIVLLGWFGIPSTEAVTASMLALTIYLLWACIGGLILWGVRSQDVSKP